MTPSPEQPQSNATLDMETIMDMIEVMEAEDVEDFGRGNVRVDNIAVLIFKDVG